MFNRILVPLDGSALAECTVGHALRVAKTFGSEVHLLTVVESHPPRNTLDGMEWQMVRAEAQGNLRRIARRLHDLGLAVETHVLEGKASQRVVDCAGEIDAALVFLSRHARGGVTDFSLSGTASKIVGGAWISVFLLGTGAGLAAGEEYRTIFAPVDCSRRSDWSAGLGARIARHAGAELVLATVVPPPELLGEPVEWSEQTRLARRLVDLNRETAENHLRGLKEQLGAEGLRVRIRITEDPHVAPALHDLSEEENASLVVFAAHGNSGHSGWSYGSVALRLLDRITRPLIVFQDLERSYSRVTPRRWRRSHPLRNQA